MFEKNKFTFLTIFAFFLGVIVYYSGLLIDLTADAGKYGAVARHIFESGDFINLQIHGDAYEQKPPLLFWLAALGFKIFGVGNIGYKIFPVLYSFLGIFFVYKLGEVLYNKRTGKIAAFLLLFSECYFLYCMDVHTDLVLQTNVTFAIWQLALYIKNKKKLNFVLGFAGVGLAMLSKGPIGAAVPALALCTHLVMKESFKQLFNLKWLIGIIIALMVASPAFIGIYRHFGLEGIKFFFITNNVGRITGEYAGSNTDYFFYFHTLLYLFAPWSLLMYAGLFFEFKSVFKKPLKQKEYFLTGGIIFYFFIISIARGKAPNYIFIIIPLFSVLTAKWISIYSERLESKGWKTLRIMQDVFLGLLWIFLTIVMVYLFPSGEWYYWAFYGIILLFCVYIFTQKEKSLALESLLLPSILTITMIAFYLNSYMLPFVYKYQAAPKAARIYNRESIPGEKMYNYLYPQFEIFFYSKTNALEICNKKSLKKILKEPGSWIFTTETGYDSIKELNVPVGAIYHLKNRGMNRIRLNFIMPETRRESLNDTYLIKSEGGKKPVSVKLKKKL